MSIPDNARRKDKRYIIFVPTHEEKEIANMKLENDKLKKRLDRLESLLLKD